MEEQETKFKVDLDRQFNIQNVFNIKNFDLADKVSVVAVQSKQKPLGQISKLSKNPATMIGIGTFSGRVMVFNKQLEKIADYQPHDKKITGICLRYAQSIISCSFDCKIFVKSLKKDEFQEKAQAIDVDQNILQELQCIDVMPNQCTPSDFECFVGTVSGKLGFIKQEYKRGIFSEGYSSTTEVIPFDSKNEGPVISVMYSCGMVIFSTS